VIAVIARHRNEIGKPETKLSRELTQINANQGFRSTAEPQPKETPTRRHGGTEKTFGIEGQNQSNSQTKKTE
jgi:hypothetical protein